MARIRSRKYGSGLPQLALIQAKELGVATPPASPASIMVTRAPAAARCQAIEAPMMPAPTMMTCFCRVLICAIVAQTGREGINASASSGEIGGDRPYAATSRLARLS